MAFQVFTRSDREEVVRRDRAMKPESKPRLAGRASAYPEREYHEPWSVAMACNPWQFFDDRLDLAFTEEPPEIDERDHAPVYIPEEDEDPGDQPWAPPVPAISRSYAFGGETLETRRKFEREEEAVLRENPRDEYEKAWVEDRRARREKVRKQHALAEVIQRVRRQREEERIWDFLPDHPFEKEQR